jgi:hypothetical protein
LQSTSEINYLIINILYNVKHPKNTVTQPIIIFNFFALIIFTVIDENGTEIKAPIVKKTDNDRSTDLFINIYKKNQRHRSTPLQVK